MPARLETGNEVSDQIIGSTADPKASFSQSLPNMRILVTDDNAMNRKLMRALLEADGYAVLEADNGVAALKLLEQNQVHAIISDILMPEMDGYRLCHEIRKSPKFKTLPFIAYTASFVSDSDERLAMQFGVDKFIRKPASNQDIINILYEVLAAADDRRKDLEPPEEAEVMREYSEVLVKKLEETTVDLTEMNAILAERTTLAEFVAAVSATLSQADDLSQMLQHCCEAMISQLGVSLARIWMRNDKENVLKLQASAGIYTHLSGDNAHISIGQSEIGLIASERAPYVTNALIGDKRVRDQEWVIREGFVAFAGYPLLTADQLVGVIAVFSRTPLSQNCLEVLSSVAHSIAVGIRRQVTERELRQSEERFRSMIESVRNYAIFMLDCDGRVVTWNKGAGIVTGYSSEEIIGKDFSCFYPADDETGIPPKQLLKTALSEGRHENTTWQVRKNGSRFWANITTTPVRYEGGRLVGFSTVARDLTHRRQIAAELEKAKEEAEAASEAKSAFLANISHEIRTPMTGIIGMAGLLYDTELTDTQKEYCEVIRRSGDSLLTIINEVLDFSKVELGKLDLEIIDFDLRSAVEEVTALFAKPAADKGLELINFIPFDVPTKLQGDPGRLRQILSNLVGNALKFTSAGEVIIRVNVVEQTKATATLRFEVSDTGIGIDISKVATLFDAFTQADVSITRKYGGTGLGLTLCKKFVDLMGGQIGVSSMEGRGSTFWFTVQLPKSQDVARATQLPRTDLHGLRMLIVETNASNRTVFEQYLSSFGIVNQSVEDGPAALELLRASLESGEAYDLAILDFRLPGMNGIELARAIRQDPRLSSVKLLLLTSVGKKGDAALAHQTGIDGYLTKPVALSQLFECLALMMGRGPRGEASNLLVTQHSLAELKSERRLRILVADDNHINQKVTSTLLENMGHRTDLVGNGKEAVEAYRLAPYDIVLLDVQMPEMDGFEASRRIRVLQRGRARRTSIIAITAHAINGFREKCLSAGFDDYVSKPILPKELKAAIQRINELGSLESSSSSVQRSSYDDIIDVADALARVEGNEELLKEIGQMFLDQCPQLLREIRQAFSSSDFPGLTSAVHTLASSAGQIGARKAFLAARRLEEIGERKDSARLPKALEQLEADLALVQSALADEDWNARLAVARRAAKSKKRRSALVVS